MPGTGQDRVPAPSRFMTSKDNGNMELMLEVCGGDSLGGNNGGQEI